ncbi:MAG: hypothetical protein GX131_11735 [candidate division WS1 bacterium]|jgi:uncharacterized integral membrane protein|nr:hypothetical protein [candidate division WS1 bacterium]
MGQAILTVLILLIFVAYAVFFGVWNPELVPVRTWYMNADMTWGAQVPLFVLPLAGLVFGAIIMAIAMSAPWSSMRRRLSAVEEHLETERARSRDRAEKIEELKERIRRQQAAQAVHEDAAPAAADSEV